MRCGLRVLATVGALLGAGCFSPVGEPDYWRYQRGRFDGGPDVEVRDGGGEVVVDPRGCPPVACSSFGAVENVEGLEAQLSTLKWTVVARPTSVCLPASSDFSVERTVNLASSDIATPAQCLTPGACAGITFDLSEQAQGVGCLDDFCTTLMLTDARFRMRLILHDQYPDIPRYVPIAEVLPSCLVPCEPEQMRCSAHATCWADPHDFCRFCIAAPQEECACLDKLETEACVVYLTNDLTCTGTCRDDRCVLNAGQPNCPAL
ncbi:MAG TPA: hypothetical protein VGK67_27590 [Myxococcales bacterium]|jgi:hypothetical protein